ncbi:MAG: hypothetical protein KC561_16595, partial [Myxococcales bacterium]|nr:hypothetical protein [Myxococcales bacterium]
MYDLEARVERDPARLAELRLSWAEILAVKLGKLEEAEALVWKALEFDDELAGAEELLSHIEELKSGHSEDSIELTADHEDHETIELSSDDEDEDDASGEVTAVAQLSEDGELLEAEPETSAPDSDADYDEEPAAEAGAEYEDEPSEAGDSSDEGSETEDEESYDASADEAPRPARVIPAEPIQWEAAAGKSFDDWVEIAEQSEGATRADAYLNATLALEAPRDPALVRDAFAAALAADSDALRWVNKVRTPFLYDPEAWAGVFESLEDHAADDPSPAIREAAYFVGFYCLGDYERAVELAGAGVGDDPEVIELAKAGNWRKVHQLLVQAHASKGRQEAEAIAGLVEANIALGLGKTEKALDSLRKLSRTVDLDPTTHELLKTLYRREEKWSPLIDLLKKEVDSAKSDEEEVSILREMVRIYRDHLDLAVMVVQTYNAILKLIPDDEESLVELTAKLEEMRRFPDLVEVLRKRAELAPSHEQRVGLLLEVANLYVDKFSNQAEAVRAYEAVLEVEPNSREAISFLAKTYKQRSDWKNFVAIRQRELAMEEDQQELVDGLAEIATAALER